MIKTLHELAQKFPNKSYNELNKLRLKQDVIKSVTQTSLNKKYGDLVENIIQRKMSEKK